MAIEAQAAEDTATRPTETCLYPDCGQVIDPERIRKKGAKFCSDKHRAAYRDLQVQLALRECHAIIQEAQDELNRLGARLEGAMAHLARIQHHGKRPQKKMAKD